MRSSQGMLRGIPKLLQKEVEVMVAVVVGIVVLVVVVGQGHAGD